MRKITSSSADYQTFPTLFELEPIAGKKVTVDFSAPELECSTISTMREKLLLSAVSIDEKKTCIRLRFSQKAPMLPEMVSVLTRLRHLPPS